MSNVELFLFILKLPPTLNKKTVCWNNDIPSPARARLQESYVLIITHSISFHYWFLRLHAKRVINICYVYMRKAKVFGGFLLKRFETIWTALFGMHCSHTALLHSLINLEIGCRIVGTDYWLICRFWLQCLIPKLCDGVVVIIFIKTIYNKILRNKIIRRIGFVISGIIMVSVLWLQW